MEITDDNTLLIVVDVNHANYTECEELLCRTKTVVFWIITGRAKI